VLTMNQLYNAWFHALFILVTGRPLNAEAILSVRSHEIAGVANLSGV